MTLSFDAVTLICSFLTPREYCSLELVSKLFFKVIQQDSVWKKSCENIGLNSTSQPFCKQLYKQQKMLEQQLLGEFLSMEICSAPDQYKVVCIPSSQFASISMPATGYKLRKRTVTADAPQDFKLLDGILEHINKTSPIILFKSKKLYLTPRGFQDTKEGSWKAVTAENFCDSMAFTDLAEQVNKLIRSNARCYTAFHSGVDATMSLDRDEEYAIIDSDKAILIFVYLHRHYG